MLPTISPLLLTISAAQLATAHFSIQYPIWRSDSLTNDSYFQYDYPCAGVPSDLPNANRTDWPLTGGSLKLDLHHPWTYIFVNLGLGVNASNFNYTLTPQFLNETGNGTLCLPKLALPSDVQPMDGQAASIQVVTLGATGSALYNCADITFRADATVLAGGECVTDKGVSYFAVGQEFNGSTSDVGETGGGSGTSNGTSSGDGSGKSAGAVVGVNGLLTAGAVGVALAFAFEIGL